MEAFLTGMIVGFVLGVMIIGLLWNESLNNQDDKL